MGERVLPTGVLLPSGSSTVVTSNETTNITVEWYRRDVLKKLLSSK